MKLIADVSHKVGRLAVEAGMEVDLDIGQGHTVRVTAESWQEAEGLAVLMSSEGIAGTPSWQAVTEVAEQAA